MSIHVFLGPTLPADVVASLVPGAVVHPPVAHGDLLRLRLGRGDVVVLVDGYYHQSASVRHKEILSLLASGVRVVGCSSMGALRAAELHPHGMIGNGVVFDLFRCGVVDADDEVAVAHTPGPEYRALSVPLVAVRFVADEAERHGVLATGEAQAIVGVAREIHYVERSWRAVEVAVPGHLRPAFDRLTGFRARRGAELDVKAKDAVDTLRRLEDLLSAGDGPGLGAADVDTWFLREWRAEFGSSAPGQDDVDDGRVLRYQQVYRRDFPVRWRRFALEEVAAGAVGGPVEQRALAAAAAEGITTTSTTAEQERHWLTPAERAEAAPEEKVLLLLVRSYRSASATHDLLTAQPDLVTEPAARRAVAEAEVVNREVASWAGNHGIDHLKRAVLVAHLAETWQLDPGDSAALNAAARDRGLGSLDRAIDAVRPFYLRARFRAAAARAAV
ncbi:hypothetical protein SUDANB95_04826 [Actinosynnema sp. ALI-1.44]